MSLLAASVATSGVSQSINNGSLVFSPIITLDSTNASIRQQTSPDQSNQFKDISPTSEARATATITPFGGGDEGQTPNAALPSNRSTQGGGPFALGGDFITSGPAPGLLDGTNGLWLMGGLAIAAFLLVRKFL